MQLQLIVYRYRILGVKQLLFIVYILRTCEYVYIQKWNMTTAKERQNMASKRKTYTKITQFEHRGNELQSERMSCVNRGNK